MGKKPKIAGIYKITCKENGKIYIGKAVDIDRRIRDHSNCKKGGRGNCLFQNAILKYGWDSFIFEILETIQDFEKTTDNIKLLEREAYYIELFESTNREKGYNRCRFSNDNTGLTFPSETREKMSKAKLGKKLSKEHAENISKANKGRTFSEEHKANMRKPKPEEVKEKLRKPKSEKARENIRLGKLNNPLSQESIEKIRQIHLGRKRSDETRERIRQSKLGLKHSEETKEKMRLSRLKHLELEKTNKEKEKNEQYN